MMSGVLIWALYDLANTFFAIAMLSFHFPLWIVEDCGAPELVFSATLAGSMILVAVLMPMAGAISDARGERLRYLRWTTFGCIAATGAIGLVHHLPAALVLFAAANICYQLGTVFYDALLWQVAPPDKLGPASGLGAAFGYLGSMLGLSLLWPFTMAGGHHAAFLPAAVFFLVFALPTLILSRETPANRSVPHAAIIRQAWQRLGVTTRSLWRTPVLRRFFLACFFSLNAINTVLVSMGVYVKSVVGFSEMQMIGFFLVGQAFAVLGALVFGRVVARLGSRRTLELIWIGWILALGLAWVNPNPRWLWVVGPMVGFCLGSTWSTMRVLIVELSPKDHLAELIGFAGLLGRAASVLGPLIWGALALNAGGYRASYVVMIGFLAVGVMILRTIPARPQPVTIA